MRAAVLYESLSPMTIEEVSLDGPRDDEVLVQVKATGACHSDYHVIDGSWNGAGYPHGLAGEEIPLGARILCAADTFDALTSKRAYRDPMEPMAALEHLKVDVGKQFDPGVYDALVRVVTRRLGIAQLQTR